MSGSENRTPSPRTPTRSARVLPFPSDDPPRGGASSAPPRPRWVAEQAEPCDADLIGRCLAGDQDAWTLLVTRYKRLVYSVIVKGDVSPDEDDVFQAVWLDVVAELGTVRDREKFRSWVCAVARHKCYHWRIDQMPSRASEPVESIADQLRAYDLSPLEIFEQRERAAILREVVRGLPERYRPIGVALFLEDPPRPYAEIVRSLGVAFGTVGSLRSRCAVLIKVAVARRCNQRWRAAA